MRPVPFVLAIVLLISSCVSSGAQKEPSAPRVDVSASPIADATPPAAPSGSSGSVAAEDSSVPGAPAAANGLPASGDYLDSGGGLWTRFYRIRHVPAGELKLFLDPWRSPQGRLQDYPHLNMLLITDTPERQTILDSVLSRIDRMSPQVEIKARVVEVRNSDALEYGFESLLTRANTSLVRKSNLVFDPSSFLQKVGSFQGAEFFFQEKGGKTIIDATVRALVERGYADILAEPRIVVHAGEEATINTVTQVPIPMVTNIANNAVQVSPQYRDIGIKLRVRPLSIGTEAALLDVSPEVSSVVSFTDPNTSGGIATPIITNRNARTVVDVRDGETLIIGGLRDRRMIWSSRGIPILSDIPLIGNLFRSKRSEEIQTEIVVLLDVTILRPDSKQVTRLRNP